MYLQRTFVIPLECTSIQYTTRKGFFTSQLMPVQNKVGQLALARCIPFMVLISYKKRHL
ncbi:unnamed protein product [Coffea canephora]|uniref:DH200=94 genomic scaffold, scaffold_386 n=1 Tax=Coffea canephora TaxID=49390 RepID=A0A068VEV4_COFCA|nr:unnamed protein product [Coffea canephora]